MRNVGNADILLEKELVLGLILLETSMERPKQIVMSYQQIWQIILKI